MMHERIRLANSHFRRTRPGDPVIIPYARWFKPNRGFYSAFRRWLREGGYGPSALNLYSVSARLALGLLNKPYWMIDHQTDLTQVYVYIDEHYSSEGTRSSYKKGLRKLAAYLALRNRQPLPRNKINWDYYCAGFPDWLINMVRLYLIHCRRAWPAEKQYERSRDTLSHLTLSLRWIVRHINLTTLTDITPQVWFGFVDVCLAKKDKPRTINDKLHQLQSFLRFQSEQEHSICERMLRLASLKETNRLPRDVPLHHLRLLYAEIEREIISPHAANRRMGCLDRAWFLLMLHSGLRTLEVRTLRQADIDLEDARLFLEQAKGLKDRLVPLSQATVNAIRVYQANRAPAKSDHLFLYRHQPLSRTYCGQRLRTYSRRCGLKVSPHQLRHSCATLLLNAGAPLLTVQTILGHKHIDTTLGYARLYDGTVAADYYQAMTQIEPQLSLTAETTPRQITPAHLLAMVDSLRQGTLNERQRETVQALRAGILSLTEQWAEKPASLPITISDPVAGNSKGSLALVPVENHLCVG